MTMRSVKLHVDFVRYDVCETQAFLRHPPTHQHTLVWVLYKVMKGLLFTIHTYNGEVFASHAMFIDAFMIYSTLSQSAKYSSSYS